MQEIDTVESRKFIFHITTNRIEWPQSAYIAPARRLPVRCPAVVRHQRRGQIAGVV